MSETDSKEFDNLILVLKNKMKCKYCGTNKWLQPDLSGMYPDAIDEDGLPYFCLCEQSYTARGLKQPAFVKAMIESGFVTGQQDDE